MFKRDFLPQFKVELKAIQTFTQDILCYLYLGLVVQTRRQYFAVPRLYNYSASSQLLPHFQSSKHLRALVQHHVSRLILGLSNPDKFSYQIHIRYDLLHYSPSFLFNSTT